MQIFRTKNIQQQLQSSLKIIQSLFDLPVFQSASVLKRVFHCGIAPKPDLCRLCSRAQQCTLEQGKAASPRVSKQSAPSFQGSSGSSEKATKWLFVSSLQASRVEYLQPKKRQKQLQVIANTARRSPLPGEGLFPTQKLLSSGISAHIQSI